MVVPLERECFPLRNQGGWLGNLDQYWMSHGTVKIRSLVMVHTYSPVDCCGNDYWFGICFRFLDFWLDKDLLVLIILNQLL
jgi:hypothetical protein